MRMRLLDPSNIGHELEPSLPPHQPPTTTTSTTVAAPASRAQWRTWRPVGHPGCVDERHGPKYFMWKIDGPPSDAYGPIYSLRVPAAGAPCTATLPHAEVAARRLGSFPRAPVLAALLRTTGDIDPRRCAVFASRRPTRRPSTRRAGKERGSHAPVAPSAVVSVEESVE